MTKTATLFVALLLAAGAAGAQSPYTLSTFTGQAYTPLTGATQISGGTPWHTNLYAMPLGFTASLAGTNVSTVFADGIDLYSDTTGASVHLFQAFYSDTGTIDRGFGTAGSRSPLLYTTTGTAPNRIFKHEVRSAGFAREKFKYGTFNDSVSFQFWLYEGSNVVELHFGPSSITHATDYFGAAGPAFTGYFNVDFTTYMPIRGFFAAGPVASPYLDSFTATHNPGNLSAFPPSGTVYRFTPKLTTGVGSAALAAAIRVYPTETAGMLHLRSGQTGQLAYSIVSMVGAASGLSGTVDLGDNAIDVSALPPGMYVLRLSGVAGEAAYRFVRR